MTVIARHRTEGVNVIWCVRVNFTFKKEQIIKLKSKNMGYKLKTHSGAAKRFKRTGSSVKSKSANRNHILTKQSTKRKRHNRGLNKLSGVVLKMASKLIDK